MLDVLYIAPPQKNSYCRFEYCGVGEHTGRPEIIVVTSNKERGLAVTTEKLFRDIKRQHERLKALQKPHVRFIAEQTPEPELTTDPLQEPPEALKALIGMLKEERFYVAMSTRMTAFDEQLLSDIDFWTVILNVGAQPHLALMSTHWWFYFSSPHFEQVPQRSTRGRRLNDMAKRWEVVVPPSADAEKTKAFFERYFTMLSERWNEEGHYQKSEIIFPGIVVMGPNREVVISELRKKYCAGGWRAI